MPRPQRHSSLQGRLFPQWLEQAGTGRGSSSTVPCRNPNTRTFLSFVLSFPIFCLCSHSPRSLHLLLLLLPPPLPQETAHCCQAGSAGIQRFALLSLPDPPSQGLLCGPAWQEATRENRHRDNLVGGIQLQLNTKLGVGFTAQSIENLWVWLPHASNS